MMKTPRAAALRVLFLSSIPRWGGGERWMVDAAAGLAARGHDVVLGARPGARLLDRARDAGLVTRAVRMGGDLDPRALLAVRRVLHEHRPHAVFVNLDKELRYVCMATVAGTRPLVFQRRGSDDPLKTGPVHRWTYTRCATRVLTNSDTLAARRLRAPEWMTPDRVRVVRNGVPVGEAVERLPLRRELRLPRRKTLIVHVGELQARKGQELTLAALARLRAASDNPKRDPLVPRVAFVGTGPDEAKLRDWCHQLGVQEHVLWLGFRTDAERYLAAADVCVLPTRAEGVPWTLLEAMASGTPVVAAAVSGIPELVEDGVHGVLIPPDDPQALADAVRRLLANPDEAQRLGRAAREHVRTHWSADAMLDDLECLMFAEIVRRRDVARGGAARRGSGAALFVDRDDTLVHNVPYNGDPAAARLVPGAGRALRWVRDAGIPVLVVTNQSGVAQGLHDEQAVHAVHARIRELLQGDGADVDALYYCPHHPDHGPPCECRKPEPGMLLRGLREHDLSADACLMVGDAQRDLDAAHAAGVPAAGLAVVSKERDLAAGESVYTSWTAVVRDFLAARCAGVRMGDAHAAESPVAQTAVDDRTAPSSTR